jgi:hypothetical protein
MTTMEVDMKTVESGRNSRTLPSTGEHVVVHCSKYSCLGYLDQSGAWKNVFTDEILSSVVGFSPID